MTDLTKLSEAVRDATISAWENAPLNTEERAMKSVDLQAIITAHAQSEPVTDSGYQAAYDQLDADGYHKARDILERTEAARLAAEFAYRNAVVAAFKINDLLAAERERLAALTAFIRNDGSVIQFQTISQYRKYLLAMLDEKVQP